MRRFSRLSTALLALGLVAAAHAQTFTYQGSLKDAGALANGAYDMQFALFDDAIAGNQIGSPVTQNDVGVAGGLFTSELDFGPAAFDGADRWLEISVNGTPLSPRTNVTPAPMAIFAMKPWNYAGGTVSYTDGNVGIGTATPATMLHVAGMVTMSGFTLPTGAGSARVLTSDAAGVGVWSALPGGLGGSGNSATGAFAVIPGGQNNSALGAHSAIGGGLGSYAWQQYSTVAGGQQNRADGISAAVGGGSFNAADADYATVAGGLRNTANVSMAAVGGGESNTADGYAAVIGGGVSNVTMGYVAVVDGGQLNLAQGQNATVGGGGGNTAGNDGATVGGGQQNTAGASLSTVSGGQSNTASEYGAAVGGGFNNHAIGYVAVVAGGQENLADAVYATVGGGILNTASDQSATVAGGQENTASGITAAVGGGFGNTAGGQAATVGGGHANTASDQSATVAGGQENNAGGAAATIGGGVLNVTSAQSATIAGGQENTASGGASAVAGGFDNTAGAAGAAVGGGFVNAASGEAATVPGGYLNTAGGQTSLAAGYRAKANHNGTFAWADGTDADFASTGPDQFLIRAAGGVRLGLGTFLDMGFGVTGREVNAGKIGYALFTPDALDIVGAGTTGPTRKVKIFAEGGTTFTGNINVNGTNYTSDRRYKTNIVTFPDALDAILNLRGVTFDWDRQQWADRGFAEGQQIGFIAQEVEEVLPELVDTDVNGYKSVAYANVVPVLVEAVKTLKQQNDATARENDELKSRVEALEQAVRRMASQPK